MKSSITKDYEVWVMSWLGTWEIDYIFPSLKKAKSTFNKLVKQEPDRKFRLVKSICTVEREVLTYNRIKKEKK